MVVAVLFDGAGLARLGLEEAGFECIGFENDPVAAELGSYVGSGNVHLEDVTTLKCLNDFQIIWASPPCQWLSVARTQGNPISKYSDNLLKWCLALQSRWLWVENVYTPNATWGTVYNAAQFTVLPFQNRNRIIGGRYVSPKVYRSYRKCYPDAIPAILATEYKGSKSDTRRASRHMGRRLSLEEVAHYQGFSIPSQWSNFPEYTQYEVIGNGVPVYMAKAFGEALMERLDAYSR